MLNYFLFFIRTYDAGRLVDSLKAQLGSVPTRKGSYMVLNTAPNDPLFGLPVRLLHATRSFGQTQ